MEEKTFNDKSEKPTEKMLKESLGNSYKHWNSIKGFLVDQFETINEEWKYYNPKSGWVLKVLLKKRNLFFFFAYDKYFRVAFVFGEKAYKIILKSDLPKKIIDEIKGAIKYAEGRGIRIEVKSQKDVDIIKQLIKIKVEN